MTPCHMTYPPGHGTLASPGEPEVSEGGMGRSRTRVWPTTSSCAPAGPPPRRRWRYWWPGVVLHALVGGDVCSVGQGLARSSRCSPSRRRTSRTCSGASAAAGTVALRPRAPGRRRLAPEGDPGGRAPPARPMRTPFVPVEFDCAKARWRQTVTGRQAKRIGRPSHAQRTANDTGATLEEGKGQFGGLLAGEGSAPGRIRTCDRRIRSPTLNGPASPRPACIDTPADHGPAHDHSVYVPDLGRVPRSRLLQLGTGRDP